MHRHRRCAHATIAADTAIAAAAAASARVIVRVRFLVARQRRRQLLAL
jgi:hypothetical protein